jgi:hypothetical protein
METHGFELVAVSSFLRWRVTGDFPRTRDEDAEHDDRLDVFTAGRLDPGLQLHLAPAIRLVNHEEVGTVG